MSKVVRYIGQAACYGLFIGCIGYFSTSPAYVLLEPGQAVLKLSVTHAGQIKQPCRRRSDQELAKLAPNMRNAMDCTRERSPVDVEIELDGRALYRATLAPTGLARDGASSVYRRFPVPSGAHTLRARLKDHADLPDFNYVRESHVTLMSGQVLVVDFDSRRGGFIFR